MASFPSRQTWLFLAIACVTAVALSFAYIDIPVAVYFSHVSAGQNNLGRDLGGTFVLSAEAATVLILALARLLRGQLSLLGKILAVACLTSICVYGVTSGALKIFFGVPNTANVFLGAKHTFNFWMGSQDSSFPSSHMALAGAFAGVFMRFYRNSIFPFSALLALTAALLIIGGWHFLSDVISGAFIGVSSGFLAGKFWAAQAR